MLLCWIDEDRFHGWANEVIPRLPAPLLTCDAVITEASFILKHVKGGPRRPLQMVRRGTLSLPFQAEGEGEAEALDRLMEKVADVPMSYADACLVRMSELYSKAILLTIDADFRIYRKNKYKAIHLLMPE